MACRTGAARPPDRAGEPAAAAGRAAGDEPELVGDTPERYTAGSARPERTDRDLGCRRPLDARAGHHRRVPGARCRSALRESRQMTSICHLAATPLSDWRSTMSPAGHGRATWVTDWTANSPRMSWIVFSWAWASATAASARRRPQRAPSTG